MISWHEYMLSVYKVHGVAVKTRLTEYNTETVQYQAQI